MIGEIIAQILVECVFYWLCYWTGHLFLSLVTGGKLKVVPFNRKKPRQKGITWDVYALVGGKKLLTAEAVCLVGVSAWVAIGITVYLKFR
jgi:hypothetical protein